MKIFLFQSTEEITISHYDSLLGALQFYQEPTDIFSDYDMPDFGLDHVTRHIRSHNDMISMLSEENCDVFVAHSSTIFTTECFSTAITAHKKYTETGNPVMIQLIFPNAILETPKPALILYGGNRLWMTGTRLYTTETTIPVAYGNSQIFTNVLKSVLCAQEFNDSIFHGGKTTLITPIPALAFNTEFGISVKIQQDAFDMGTYIQNIPPYFMVDDNDDKNQQA